jgi:hypothetical protein
LGGSLLKVRSLFRRQSHRQIEEGLVKPLCPEDDLRHDLSGSRKGRESLFWLVPLPDENLMLLVYVWLYADGSAGRFVIIGENDPTAPPVHDAQDRLEFVGKDLDDCSIGGLGIRLPELFKTSELSYDTGPAAFDLHFEAIHRPFSYHDNADGCPSWLADNRFEQSLSVTGRLRLGNRHIEIDTTAHRDHSWGTRDWALMQQWQWINVQDGTGTTVNAYTNVVLGERTVNGYLYRDGRLSPLVEVRTSPEFGPDYHQNALHAEFVDTEGRTAVLDATRNSAVRLDFGSSPLLINEIGCHGTLEGRPVPLLYEIGWDGNYIRRLMKRAATRAGQA